MTFRHLVPMLVALVACGVLAPVAAADPQPLDRIQQQAGRTAPDGFQPQLRSTGGASSHPDNLVRPQLPGGTAQAAPAAGGFDWDAGAVGLAAGLMLSVLAAGVVAAGRARGTLAQS